MLLPLETVKFLSRSRPLDALLHVCVEWGLIVGALVATFHHPHPLAIALAIVWIGSRQLALFELLHGCVHWSLFRHSRLNDWVGDWILAWPLFVALEPLRQRHLAHHRYLNTLSDPEWDPRSGDLRDSSRWLMVLLLELTGLPSIRRGWLRLRTPLPPGYRLTRGHRILRAVALVTVTAVAMSSGLWTWLLGLWVVPRFTWVPFVRALRDRFEHGGLPERVPALRTRSIEVAAVLEWLMVPKHARFHEAHHLYPSVPFQALPALQAELQNAGMLVTPVPLSGAMIDRGGRRARLLDTEVRSRMGMPHVPGGILPRHVRGMS